MLKACVLDFLGSWDKYLLLIEFSYNNSYQVTIGIPPYKLSYGRKYRSPIHLDKLGESKFLGPELVREKTEAMEKKKMLATQSRQNCYVGPKRRNIEFSVGDKIFLKVAPMK